LRGVVVVLHVVDAAENFREVDGLDVMPLVSRMRSE